MFRALEIGSVIDLDPGQLIAIERSTNTQSLALGGGARKPTRAFILSFFEAHGAYRVAVFLGRIERDREGRPHGLLFRCDPPQVPLTGYEALLREYGYALETVPLEAGDCAFFIDGRGAGVIGVRGGEKKRLGCLGEIHPEVLERFKLVQPVSIFELDADAL